MQAPDRLEHFDIMRRDDGTAWELGRGAMGVTYKARDARLHSDVALKVIHPLLHASKEVHDRFLREARAAAALRHPNIASAMHLGETPDGGWFYVMEFCEGPTLQEAVAADGPFPPPKAVEMTTQIARALLAAEAKGIVHRDLKPANLILTERAGEGMVTKVIDFGLARALDAGGAAAASLATQGTGFLGTVQFASPEQLEERPVDVRSDFYSLGACLWYALKGQPVFRGPLARVMAQTLSAEPNWGLLKDTPPQVIVLLKKLLAKNPDARPANGAALLSECLACQQSLTTSTPLRQTAPAEQQPMLQTTVDVMHLNDGETLLGRYRVQGVPARHLLGTDALLTDIEAIDEPPLRGLFVDATVLSAPPVLKRLQALITGLHEHPHAALPAVVTWAEFGADWLVVMERAEGCPLLDVLKARSTLPLREALDWLLPVAEAMDHMQEHRLGMLEAGLGAVTIHFEGEVKDAKALLRHPREKWPRHRIIADAFAWEQSADGPHTPSTMPTVAARQVHAAGENAPSPGTPAALIAALVMELAGGKPPQTGRYTPLPRLSEEANAQLRQAWLSGTANTGAAKLIRQLKQGLAMEDDLQAVEKAPRPLQAVPKPEKPAKAKKPVPLPAPETAAKPPKKHAPQKKALFWLPHALAACLIVAGVVYAFTAGGGKSAVTQQEPPRTDPPKSSTPLPDDSKPKTAGTEEKVSEPPPPEPVPVAQVPAPEPASKPGDDIPPYARGISNADEIVSAGPTPAVTHAAPVVERIISSGREEAPPPPQPITPSPPYPDFAKAQKMEGTMRLSLVVGPNGAIEGTKVISSSGFTALDTYAVDWVHKNWRFPASSTNKTYTLPLTFRLTNLGPGAGSSNASKKGSGNSGAKSGSFDGFSNDMKKL